MSTFEEILATYTKHVNLPWASDTPFAGRVWIVWFDKSMQRQFSGRVGEFEHATQKAGHGWGLLDLAPWFGNWIVKHELFEGLVEQPNEIRGLFPDIEDALVEEIEVALTKYSANDVVAVDGCGALFGVARVSTLISRVASAVPGRLLVAFPGKHSAGVYRLLDARDGWNYHAVPIPPDPTV